MSTTLRYEYIDGNGITVVAEAQIDLSEKRLRGIVGRARCSRHKRASALGGAVVVRILSETKGDSRP